MSARFGFPSLAGTAPDAAAALPIGTQIESHTVLQVLSESRYGFVYLTRDDVLGATRVLKEFMPRSRLLRLSDGSVRPCDVSDSIATSVARIAFMNEANALAAVQHPCLVHVFGTIPAHRTLYRVMPLVDGVSLEHHCRSWAEPPTLAWVAGLVDNLLQAVQALHERGLAHGCVQPQQVMVRESGQALLLGFASVARELDNAPSTPWQSPAAPQLTRHAPPNPADDFAALAATAYFAATGLTAPTPQQRSAGAVLDLRQALTGLPDGAGDTPQRRRGLIQALEAGLARAAEARPQSVAEFRRLLAGDAPLRSVTSEPAPRWVGVVPRRSGDDVDGLISQPAPLDDAGPLLRSSSAPERDPGSTSAPSLVAATAASTQPAAARAPTTETAFVDAPIVPLAVAPAAVAPPDRIEPSWRAPEVQPVVPPPAAAPVPASTTDTPDLTLGFEATMVALSQSNARAASADMSSPDTEPFVSRLAPRRQTRWPSRALAASFLVAVGVAAAWWFTSAPTDGSLATTTVPTTAAERSTPAATPVPALPATVVSPTQTTARATIPPPADPVPATTLPATDTSGSPGPTVPPAAVIAAPPVLEVASPAAAVAAVAPPLAAAPQREPAAPPAPGAANPAESRSASAGRTPAAATSAQRSANLRSGSATASRSATPRQAATRNGSANVAGRAGARPEARLRSPLALCGKRTQFSLVYCLQQQCARSQYRAHPQCVEVRNGG